MKTVNDSYELLKALCKTDPIVSTLMRHLASLPGDVKETTVPELIDLLKTSGTPRDKWSVIYALKRMA